MDNRTGYRNITDPAAWAHAGRKGLPGLGEESLVVPGTVGVVPGGGAGARRGAPHGADLGEPALVQGRQARQRDRRALPAVPLHDREPLLTAARPGSRRGRAHRLRRGRRCSGVPTRCTRRTGRETGGERPRPCGRACIHAATNVRRRMLDLAPAEQGSYSCYGPSRSNCARKGFEPTRSRPV